MHNLDMLMVVLTCAGCTFLTRALPFLVFRNTDQIPLRLRYVSKKLPLAIMLLLVLYCLKDTVFLQYPYGLPQGIAVIAVVRLHLWKRNIIISIAGGTLLYMVLLQIVFV